jgi:hypothetical protein
LVEALRYKQEGRGFASRWCHCDFLLIYFCQPRYGPGIDSASNINDSSSSSSIGTTTLRWVSACSTIVEHSQQEGFTEYRYQRHVKTPTWRRTRDLERSYFRHKRPLASEATLANPAAEGGTMGKKWPKNFAEIGDFHFNFVFFYMP